MNGIRRFYPNRQQYDRFKRESIKSTSKIIKPMIESGYVSAEIPTHPLPGWILKNKVLFRGLYDISNPKLEWSARHFSERIRSKSPQNTVFFIDTSFFSTPIDFLIWDSILSRKIAITPSINGELTAWLGSPHHNKELSKLISDQKNNGMPQIEFLSLDTYYDYSFSYYMALLCLRKDVWKKVLPGFAAMNGREPTDAEMQVLLQKEAGDNVNLAFKGWTDRHKPNRYADEELVVASVLTSILRGAETVILTRDNDILSQFINLTNLIKAHYISMHAGNYVSSHLEDFPNLLPPRLIPEFEKKPVLGITKISGFHFPSGETYKVLPGSLVPALMHCLHFERSVLSQRFSVASFYGETGMREILSMKGSSNGKNTNKFGEYNCCLTEGLEKFGKLHASFLVHNDSHVTVHNQVATEFDCYHASKKKQISSHMFYTLGS